MGARQSSPESEALITSGEALQLNADPLSPAFLASGVMRSLILGGGMPTASMKRALGWLLYNRRERGADPATSRLLNFPGLEARPPPEKIKYEEEELVVIEAALRMECWPNPPPRGIRWGKVERRAVQRMLSTPWTFFKTGHWRGVDPAQLKLDVLAAAAFGFLGREEGDVKALARFELTTPKASKALFVGSRLALLRKQFLEDGSGRIGILSSWKRSPRKFVGRFDDGSEEEFGVSALFGNIVKSRSLEGGVVLCRKTEVDVLNWYKGAKMRRLQSAASAAASSSLEKEIDEAIRADPGMQARALMELSDARLHASELGIRVPGAIKGANWNKAQGSDMERQGVKTVRDLALVNMGNTKLVLMLTLCDDTADGRRTARRTLWRRKCAAAALLGVKLGDKRPSILRTKKSSGGDGVAEPKEKKQRS